MTKLENALIWLYVKTWGSFGKIDIKEDLWNFTANDLETAIMGLAYPRKNEKSERVQARDERTLSLFENMSANLFLFSNKNRTRTKILLFSANKNITGTKNISNTANENKESKNMRVLSSLEQALNNLIMEKFEDGGLAAFREWSGEIHNQFIETLPETVADDPVNKKLPTSRLQVVNLFSDNLQRQPSPVKISKWLIGKHYRSVSRFCTLLLLLNYSIGT